MNKVNIKKHATRLGLLLLGITNLKAQPFNVELTLKFNTTTSEYEVYARPGVTETFSMGGGSQISVVLPASVANNALTIVDAAGGPWTDNSQVYAPSAQPGSDFHGIATNGTQAAISFVANEEKMLFKFSLAGGCVAGVRVYRNAAEGASPRDPDSGQPGMQGGDFENYITKVSPIAQRYAANYNNTGTTCGGSAPGVLLAAKVFLQGAYDPTLFKMRDDLRAENKLPVNQPFSAMARFAHHTGTEARGANAFNANGDNSVVDWVFVELRNAADASEVAYTRAALVQKDGDIVDVDGVSPLSFPTATAGNYYVSVNHRNHLGAMTALNISLNGSTPTTVDFTVSGTSNYGSNAQKVVGARRALWGGNANNDDKIIFAGPNNDSDRLKDDVLFASGNATSDFAYIEPGYRQGDHNLDGEAVYQGPANDIDPLVFFNVMNHPGNSTFNPIFVIYEQLP